MANNFKNINYGNLVYETLRNYYSVNTSEELSILYKFVSACVMPLQGSFNAYAAFRTVEAIIANCQWQIGQLTNVLNYLYDNVYNRIFITQSVLEIIADPMFAYPPINFDSDFATAPVIGSEEREFGDRTSESIVTINIPSTINLSAITATIEQIRIQGIPYQILTF